MASSFARALLRFMNTRTLVATPLAILVYAAAVGGGCSSANSNGFADGTGGGVNGSGGTQGFSNGSTSFGVATSGGYTFTSTSTTVLATGDASSPAVTAIQGNPLCNASRNSGQCYPDDFTTAQSCGIVPDGSPAFDLDGGSADAAVACHVAPSSVPDAGPTPVCRAAGTGGDGDGCHGPTDCAPSFECVGAGICRQYCCYAACDTTQFCDIQRETPAAGGLPVPVCMPIRPCTLLDESSDGGGCYPNETCAVVAIVDGNPMTSCVANGTANVGESCDSEHCAGGSMCVGNPGSRRCYQLCHTADASSECPASQTCTGGLPLFTDPLTGVCKAPITADL